MLSRYQDPELLNAAWMHRLLNSRLLKIVPWNNFRNGLTDKNARHVSDTMSEVFFLSQLCVKLALN